MKWTKAHLSQLPTVQKNHSISTSFAPQPHSIMMIIVQNTPRLPLYSYQANNFIHAATPSSYAIDSTPPPSPPLPSYHHQPPLRQDPLLRPPPHPTSSSNPIPSLPPTHPTPILSPASRETPSSPIFIPNHQPPLQRSPPLPVD